MWTQYKDLKHCRWCGLPYKKSKPIGKDGFHSAACKQAHHRAYKKWVTQRRSADKNPTRPGRTKK